MTAAKDHGSPSSLSAQAKPKCKYFLHSSLPIFEEEKDALPRVIFPVWPTQRKDWRLVMKFQVKECCSSQNTEGFS